MTLTDFLIALSSGGLASTVVAFVLERLSGFQALSSGQKQSLVLALTAVLAAVAYLVLLYVPKETLAQLSPAFQLIGVIASSWCAGQFAHRFDPATK